MRRYLTPILAALCAAAATGGIAIASRGGSGAHARKSDNHAAAYDIGLWGRASGPTHAQARALSPGLNGRASTLAPLPVARLD